MTNVPLCIRKEFVRYTVCREMKSSDKIFRVICKWVFIPVFFRSLGLVQLGHIHALESVFYLKSNMKCILSPLIEW